MAICFRWRKTSSNEWTSVLAGRVWTLSQDNTHIFYKVWKVQAQTETKLISHKVLGISCSDSDTKPTLFSNPDVKLTVSSECDIKPALLESSTLYESILKDYFQLHTSLEDLYAKWCKADIIFAAEAGTFSGVRMLRQDPVENLFSFICSSNNHISRIGNMVEKLCIHYGPKVAEIDGYAYHSFPTIEALAEDGVEQKLRELGFGYRAKYISQTAQYMERHHSVQWLHQLRNRPYDEAKQELIKLCGVGAKVSLKVQSIKYLYSICYTYQCFTRKICPC